MQSRMGKNLIQRSIMSTITEKLGSIRSVEGIDNLLQDMMSPIVKKKNKLCRDLPVEELKPRLHSFRSSLLPLFYYQQYKANSMKGSFKIVTS